MTIKTHLYQRKEVMYLSAYFTLLLISVAGLILQGGVWLVIGITGWLIGCLAIFACLIRYNYHYISKNNKTTH